MILVINGQKLWIAVAIGFPTNIMLLMSSSFKFGNIRKRLKSSISRMMNRSLLAKEASKTVIPGSCALATSSCREGKGARASQMFDSHKLKLLSITSENIFPVVFDDCIEQGERGRCLGKDNSACATLVEANRCFSHHENDDCTARMC